MKKMFLGLSSVLLVVSSVMGMHAEDGEMPKRPRSAPPFCGASEHFDKSSRPLERVSKKQRRHSAPTTKKELRSKIGKLIPLVLVDAKQVDKLVELLCDPAADAELAMEAHNSFVSSWSITDTSLDQQNCAKCAHLLDDIRFSKIMGAVFLAQHFLGNLRSGKYGPFDVSDLPDW